MSVEELRFEWQGRTLKVDRGNSDFKILIIDCCHTEFYLDRKQAHLLMLYLQEHLK